MFTVILAAGEQTRFSGEIPKQMLPNRDGVPILLNTLQLINATVFTDKKQIIEAVEKVIIPQNIYHKENRCTVSSLFYSTYKNDDNLVLLGDVIFTAEAIEKLSAEKTTFFISEDTQEIYAVYIKKDDCFFWQCCLDVISLFDTGECTGKLWHLYRKYFDIPIHEHIIKEAVTIPGCMDIDYPQEYTNYLQGFLK